MPRKKKVPEVLWRLFKDRAHTLANGIVSLLPPPRAECYCKGRRCLGCSSADASSFLLRPNDPLDYRRLLDNCFVVIDVNAPPLLDFYPDCRWSQQQIVARTIEMIICEKRETHNVICDGYDKWQPNWSYAAMKLLTCSAWRLLLERIGDDLMVYMLKHASIFLPLHKKHHQVAGYPISKLRLDLPKNRTDGPQKKRKRVDVVNSVLEGEKSHGPFRLDAFSNHISCVDCYNGSCLRPLIRRHQCNSCEMGSSEVASPAASSSIDIKRDLKGELQSNQREMNNNKRRRPFRWQRHRKHRKITCISIPFEKASLSEKLSDDLKFNLRPLHEMVPPHCTCCFMFSALDLPTRRIQIDRKPMLYNLQFSSSVFPRTHRLNNFKANFSGAKLLFNDIFGISDINSSVQSVQCIHSSNFCLSGSGCLYHSILKLLRILLRRIRCCNHLALLNRHCGTLSSDGCCSQNQVVSFIWAVCRNIVPEEMLGTTANMRVLRRNIYKFIQLRRFEKFSLKQCTDKLKTSGFPFLLNSHSVCYWNDQMLPYNRRQHTDMRIDFSKLNNVTHIMKWKIFERWIFWFVSTLVVPLVEANFYVTETQNGKQSVYYYRKSAWGEITHHAIRLLEDGSYRELDDVEVRQTLESRPFGFSKLRFLPKEKGVRMLVNLKAPSKMPLRRSSLERGSRALWRKAQLQPKTVRFKYYKSVNTILRGMHAILKGLHFKEPEKLGSSVFDYNNGYKHLCPFLNGLKNKSATSDAFIVVADVSKAFDSVNQDKLLSVLRDVLDKDQYVVKQSCQVLPKSKSLWLRRNLVMDGCIGNSSARLTSSDPFHSLHGILVTQVNDKMIKREELLFIMEEHIKRNVLKFGNKFYLQSIGIPQGSILSPLLCSFYYGDLDREVIFPFLEKAKESSFTNQNNPNYLLLRFTDDFLFMSTSKDQASSFFHRLRRGFRGYNCYMNDEKFGLNFDIENVKEVLSNRVYIGEDGISFIQWSGLLINCCTLEVQADYTRYSKYHISSTLTVCWQGSPGRHLKEKLCAFMRPKCHPIFFDSNINSAAIVRLNIYQAFLACAMKFHCYVRDLSSVSKLSSKYYLCIIKQSMRYMHVLIKRRFRSLNLGSCRPVLHLKRGEVEWLGLNAYIQVLKRKQSRHTQLLSLLSSQLTRHRISGMVSPHLKYAIDGSHSSSLLKIKY